MDVIIWIYRYYIVDMLNIFIQWWTYPICWCYCRAGLECTEWEWVSGCVTSCVTLAKEHRRPMNPTHSSLVSESDRKASPHFEATCRHNTQTDRQTDRQTFRLFLNTISAGAFSDPLPRQWSSLRCRLQLKYDGTRWRTGGEVKGKLANGVGSQYSSHYLGIWCIQHYYSWCAHLGCQQSTELTPPADLNGLVRFAVRRNLVSARVPSRFKLSLRPSVLSSPLINDPRSPITVTPFFNSYFWDIYEISRRVDWWLSGGRSLIDIGNQNKATNTHECGWKCTWICSILFHKCT
jgi:hypothetical protein